MKELLHENYDASFRIDSVKQDSILFALQFYIHSKVRVFYIVINNDKIVLNTYYYTFNAMNCDSVYYQIAESHYSTVAPNSELLDSTKIGIGNIKIAWTRIDNSSFQ